MRHCVRVGVCVWGGGGGGVLQRAANDGTSGGGGTLGGGRALGGGTLGGGLLGPVPSAGSECRESTLRRRGREPANSSSGLVDLTN